jgi:hypothetical protein
MNTAPEKKFILDMLAEFARRVVRNEYLVVILDLNMTPGTAERFQISIYIGGW